MRLPRRTFYGIVVTILVGMIAGLLEIIYDLVADGDPGQVDEATSSTVSVASPFGI